jgi:acetate kinase
MPVLVLNAGSSTLKAAVLDPHGLRGPALAPLAAVEVELGADASRSERADTAVEQALAQLADRGVDAATITAVGHRVVHGGSRPGPLVIDDAVLAEIDALAALAPLHNPVAAAAIRAARTILPELVHVAAFDTSFHTTLDDAARTYAVPVQWRRDWGVQRAGFHGLAASWAVRRAAELLDQPVHELGLVVVHLGSGCSVTAVENGRSVDTSMGMTPLEGLVMGTRAGSIDPGILLRLLREGHRSVDELAEDLDHRSGLLGVSERSADVRELLAAEQDGDAASGLALALFVRRAAGAIASATTSLTRLDGIVFGGGIGQHSAEIRRRIVGRLAALGVAALPTDDGPLGADGATSLDARSSDGDRVISAAGAAPSVLRVATREDIVIAEAVVAAIA